LEYKESLRKAVSWIKNLPGPFFRNQQLPDGGKKKIQSLKEAGLGLRAEL
tara:strand:+ start:3200 stop:3349 length:150 start_codon:yes stop_codon:yes gene_type:complete